METSGVPDNASIFSSRRFRPQSSQTSPEPFAEASSPQDSHDKKLLSEACDIPVANVLPTDDPIGVHDPATQSRWALTRSRVSGSPYDYISTMPSKNVRAKFIDALNVWYGAPADKVRIVKEVTNMLHHSSLILDDFQDDSPLRRGQSSTHTVFGPAQSINTATYMIVKAILLIQENSSSGIAAETIRMILTLFEGQAMDLHWTFNVICPSVEEYTQMIRDKTGGLFGLASRLLMAFSKNSANDNATSSVDRLVGLWGEYFQIRDDYMNLTDTHYSQQKGFCEDLDEGKFSLPLIHAIKHSPESLLLTNMLSMRRMQGRLTLEQKSLILEEIKACGGLERTEAALGELHRQIVTEVCTLETSFCQENPYIRGLTDKLST